MRNIKEIIDSVRNNGFSFAHCLSPDMPTEQLSHAIGEPIALSATSPVHTLTPKLIDEAPFNTYSGNYGLGEFPLHTDLANWYEPPRYLMLRCAVGTTDVATTVCDPTPIIASIGIHNLNRALMRPRRRVAGRFSLLPIADVLHGVPVVRWDERYLQPASRIGEVCFAIIGEMLREIKLKRIILTHPGDIIVIDNWKMLHGRSAVPAHSRSRRIERVYLKALAQ